MTISKFKRIYEPDAKAIPLTSILIKEKIHLKGLEKKAKIPTVDEPLCIVRKINENEYVLVTGFRDYMNAKSKELNEISVIIVPDKTRRRFLKSLDMTFEMVETTSLSAPSSWGLPSPEKIKYCIDKYRNQGVFGKRIAVTSKGKILDGYSAVCAARQLGLTKIPVCVFSERRWNFLNCSYNSKKST